MNKIDCFIIGHNEVDANRQRQIIRLSYGESSTTYRERIKYNLAQIRYKNKYYTPVQFLNEFYRCEKDSTANNELDVFNESFSLTVGYLGSYLHRKGFTIDFINTFNKDKEKLISALKEKRIRTVAITTTYHVFPFPVVEIISLVRKYDDTVKIIVGGPYIANQVRALEESDLQKLFTSLGADVYVYSPEGEFALEETVRAFKEGLTLENISNIYYKSNDGYVFTTSSIEENSLDDNIVDWQFFAGHIGSNVNIRTSVSCPYSCAFCVFPKHAGRYRMASISAIEKELDSLKRLGTVTGFTIIDDTLNVSPQRFKEFLEMLIRNKYNFKWSSFLRCQNIDRETVQMMKESGCQAVFCGIESGSQKILDIINKKAKAEEYIRGIKLLNEFGIISIASVIVGLPGETHDTFMETYNLIEEAEPTFFQERLWAYDHKASIHERHEEFKLEGSDYDWKHATMDSETALSLGNKMFMEIKNSIHVTEYPLIFQLINRGMNIDQVKNFFRCYNECLKESIISGKQSEVSEELIEKLKSSLS